MLWKKFAHPCLFFLICEKFTQILDAWMHKGPKSTLRFVLNAGILQHSPLLLMSSALMCKSKVLRSVGLYCDGLGFWLRCWGCGHVWQAPLPLSSLPAFIFRSTNWGARMMIFVPYPSFRSWWVAWHVLFVIQGGGRDDGLAAALSCVVLDGFLDHADGELIVVGLSWLGVAWLTMRSWDLAFLATLVRQWWLYLDVELANYLGENLARWLSVPVIATSWMPCPSLAVSL
jgi:hypothetical protein